MCSFALEREASEGNGGRGGGVGEGMGMEGAASVSSSLRLKGHVPALIVVLEERAVIRQYFRSTP